MKDESKNKLLAFFLKARNDAIYQLNHFTDGKEIRYEFTYKSKIIMLGLKGIQSLDIITETLNDNEIIGKRFSSKSLRREVQGALGEIIISQPKRIKESTKEIMDNMLKKLEDATFFNWSIAIPIVNLELKIPSIQIGKVTIKICDDEMFEPFKQVLELNRPPTEVMDESLSWTRKFIGKPIAICVVSAADKEHAFESANIEIERVINILRFYSRGTMKNDAITYRMFIGRVGYAYTDQFMAFCSLENTSGQRSGDSFNFDFQHTGYLYPYVLDSETLDRMKNHHFSKLRDILEKADNIRKELERRVLNGIDLCGSAMNESNQTIAFIEFIVSLESSLMDKWEPQKGLLAERIALMIKEHHQERLEIFNEMERLYQLRSNFVHSGTWFFLVSHRL
jgi:hypothetical protein